MSKPETSPSLSQMMLAFRIAGQLGFIIGLPIVIGAVGGRLIDKAAGSSPIFLLLGIICAAATSAVWVYRSLDGLRRDFEKHTK